MEIGIDSFAAILRDPATGRLPSATDRMAELLEEITVATVSVSMSLALANTIAPSFSTPRRDHSCRRGGPYQQHLIGE